MGTRTIRVPRRCRCRFYRSRQWRDVVAGGDGCGMRGQKDLAGTRISQEAGPPRQLVVVV